ncbi:MAG: HAMP domain-containing histidine kinase [Melioribacteraceae bacterium]|nr:HAMP domain-containing histidine kinase [Melioribacteraceae bacterium]
MKNRKPIKLLSKISFLHMIFTLLFLYIFAWFTISEIEEYILKEIEHRFNWTEDRIVKSFSDSTVKKRFYSFDELTEVSPEYAAGFITAYKDTIAYNERSEKSEHYRQKNVIVGHEGKFIKAKLHKNIGDFYEIKEEIYDVLLPSSIILAVFFILFNSLSSGYFLRPFYRILNQIKTYSVNGKNKPGLIKTNTTEFLRLQNLFSGMISRIEFDYKKLKEYTENMAHEIQTPLAIIRSKTENLMSDEQLIEKHSELIKSIYSETNHLSNLGITLNLLTKIENEEFNKKDNILTKAVIENHINAVKELSELKNLKIESDLSEDHSIEIDPYLLDIVIKNLIKNTIRYGSTQGSIKIITDSRKLEISNFGEPLSFASEEIFTRFSKNDKSSQSLGLGLSIVKTICDMNDLEISYKYEGKQHKFIIEKR